MVSSTRQPRITWAEHEPLHSEPWHVSVVFAVIASLRPHESVDDSFQPLVLAYEPVVQSDEPQLQSDQSWLFSDITELQPDKSELLADIAELQPDEPHLFPDQS